MGKQKEEEEEEEGKDGGMDACGRASGSDRVVPFFQWTSGVEGKGGSAGVH